MVSIEYKLLPPPIPGGTLSRRELIGRLEKGLNKRLVLVTAGAGFGKSTLLSEFAREVEIPFAWYGL